jgi:hypothetical protein
MTKPSIEKVAVRESVSAASYTSRRFNLISAALSFMLWGTWGWYANSQPQPGADGGSAVVSGLTQGIGSSFVTLIMVRSVAWLYHRLSQNPLAMILPAIITVTSAGTCMTFAHMAVGTQNIFGTLAPALTVATLFNVFTTFKISRLSETSADYSE